MSQAAAATSAKQDPSASQTGSPLIRWVQWALLAIIAIMPFHAILSVALGHFLGHQSLWQSWKEIVLVIAGIMTVIVLRREPHRLRRLRHPAAYLSVGFVLVGLIVTVVMRPPLTPAIFGLKTDAEFLLAFLLAWLVGEPGLMSRAARIMLISSGGVIAFGLLQIYVLPANWLAHLGYGPTTIMPYELVDPAVHAIRILSTLGGPNQLGSFLILPLCAAIWGMLWRFRWWQPLYAIAGLIVLWHTYSRSALLGLAAGIVILLMLRAARPWRLPILLGATIIAAVTLQILITGAGQSKLQYYVFHQTVRQTGIDASSTLHALALDQGYALAKQHPLGLGLGSAGPASFRSAHPVIPEDYYLQIAIETGVIGLLLLCAAQVATAWRLWQIGRQSLLAPPLVAAMAGLAVINIFLQGWADSSTALVYWSLAGLTLGAFA